jgi:mannose-1-phosphate guanylyltransferase
MQIIPIILSGGVGSRLWPLSREHFPKQCLPLADSQYSLLQQTVLRIQGFESNNSL